MLYWGKRKNGPYMGPEGRRKLYIGNDPQRIEEAGQRILNGRRYNALCQQMDALRRHIAREESAVAALLGRLAGYALPEAAVFAAAKGGEFRIENGE